MKRLLLNLQLLVCFFCVGCSSEVDDNHTNGSVNSNMLYGEWGLCRTEGYLNDGKLVFARNNSNSNQTYYIFQPENYFCYVAYNSEGTFSLNGQVLKINEYYTDNATFTILKLDKDSLIIREPYPDTEYDIQIQRFKRLSYYEGSDVEISDEMKQFLGTWTTTNSKGTRYLYQFREDGIVYFANLQYGGSVTNENIGPGMYGSKGTWVYDSSSKILATTLVSSPVSDLGSVFEVLTFTDDFWTGRISHGSNVYIYTFTRVNENSYNP